MKKRIGMPSFWGWGRGLAYAALIWSKMLIPEYDVYILKQGKNKIDENFKVVDVHIEEVPGYHIDKEVFKNWIKKNKIDLVIFNEYNQWGDDGQNLVREAKELGCVVYGYLVMERFKKSLTKDYDRLICPTRTHQRFLRMHKVRNHAYVPHSVDFKNEFQKYEPPKNEKFMFFHPGGWGGVHHRKNTDKVLKAFSKLKRDDVKLIITSQRPITIEKIPKNVELINKNLTRKEFLEIFRQADCTVVPSKWETVGLPILESLALGIPVITVDIPPMNEFVQTGVNGYLCTPNLVEYTDISVLVAEVDSTDLKNKMINIMNKSLLPILKNNSRFIAEEKYDIEKNKKYLLDIVKKDIGV